MSAVVHKVTFRKICNILKKSTDKTLYYAIFHYHQLVRFIEFRQLIHCSYGGGKSTFVNSQLRLQRMILRWLHIFVFDHNSLPIMHLIFWKKCPADFKFINREWKESPLNSENLPKFSESTVKKFFRHKEMAWCIESCWFHQFSFIFVILKPVAIQIYHFR